MADDRAVRAIARRLADRFLGAARQGGTVSRYWSDPSLWARECIRWPEGQGLADYQDEMLTKLVSERRVLGRGPRGYGKSAEFALAVCWFATTREGAEVAWKIVTTAGGWSQLRDYLWPEIHLWVGRIRWDVLGMQPWRQDRELLRLEIRLRHGSAMAANPKVSAKIEGGHAEQFLYVFDEAKLIPSTTWDSAEGSAASATGDRELRWLAQSSGGEADGRFFEIASGKVRGWWPRHVTKDEAIAAGRMNEAWADEMLDLWGENSPPYQNHVLGNFAATGGANTVIRLSDVERAFERWREWDRNGRPGEDDQAALGVDVGSGNLDRDPATIARRCGDGGNVVSSVDVLRFSDKYPEMELAGQVRARLGAGGHAVIDAIGQGAGVISRLLEAPQMDARAFIAGGGSVEKDASGLYGFVNQRAEAWWKFREALADPDSEIALPPDPILLGELVAPSWKTVSIGKILVESKDEIAKRLAKLESRKALNEGGSTNRADAVIQSFVGNAAVELAPGATRLGYSEMGDIEECRW